MDSCRWTQDPRCILCLICSVCTAATNDEPMSKMCRRVVIVVRLAFACGMFEVVGSGFWE